LILLNCWCILQTTSLLCSSIKFSKNVSAFHPLLLSLCSIIRIFVATWWRFWLNPVSDSSNLSECILQKHTLRRENANITCMDKSEGLPKSIEYFWQHTRIDTISCSRNMSFTRGNEEAKWILCVDWLK